jgi:hypothetical protein
MSECNVTSAESPRITAKAGLEDILQKALAARSTPSEPHDFSGPASDNPAVARCCHAYASNFDAARKRGESRYAAESAAKKAFCNSMPPLSGAQNIRDFIACVTQGMLINALAFSDGTRLLYAAQVAYSTVETRSHHSKRRPGSEVNSQKPPETAP